MSALLRSLAEATVAHPLERKLLVCNSRTQGIELLRALSLSGAAWVAWEIRSLWSMALDLAQVEPGDHEIVLADQFRTMRLIDDALDTVIARGNADLRAATGSVSFRAAVHRSIHLLRSAGRTIDVEQVDGRILRATVEVLHEYERRLAEEKLHDPAMVLRHALQQLAAGVMPWQGSRIFIAPALRFGLRGQLLDGLLRLEGAQLLESDPVFGLDAPPALLRRPAAAAGLLARLHDPETATEEKIELSLFAAATPMDELREVLRRISAQNLPFDQVEIIATDARTYGSCLYALTRRLGIPLTLSTGIDFARTRTGRAVRVYLRWLRDSFPAETFRLLLESGDVGPRGNGVTGPRLAYRLRRLRVGWGKERYFTIIEDAWRASLERPSADDERDLQEAKRDRERERAEVAALRDVFYPILRSAPDAPPRLHSAERVYPPASIAEGLLSFLEQVAPGDDSDTALRDTVRERLQRAAKELVRETSWESAIAIISRIVEAPASAGDEEASGWASAPGRLHFSDLTHGGYAGRPHTFVVGLDAGRVAANAAVDPILTDRARRELLGLPTAVERAGLRRYQLAELLAAARGAVTLSFAAWDATEGRAVPPAMELLQALRLRERNAALTYEDLHRELGSLVAAVPPNGGLLDAADVWLHALVSADGVLRAASPLVEAAYPNLRRGQIAERARKETVFNAYHGLLRRPANATRLFSATQLEALGTCPRKYFYRYLLRIDPPEILTFDAERWLDPRERGSLLHRAYEQILRHARERGVSYHDRAFKEITREALDESIEHTKKRLPPPGDEVLQREIRELKEDVNHFFSMIRRHEPNWLQLEFEFGERDRVLEVETMLGTIRLRGAIDRVDRLEDGRLVVIDYKTGSTYGYNEKWPFNGGRRIQHVVYSLAAAHFLEGEVAAMEYHFPTRRGDKEIKRYWTRQLLPLEESLVRLLRIAAGSAFPATDTPRDCTFCDFREVCRVRLNDYGKVATAPRAWWSRDYGMELEEGRALRVLRHV